MTYPSLVRDRDCKVDIDVTLYSDNVGEEGEPVIILSKKLKCNFQSSSKQRYDANHNTVQLSAIAYFNGDVFDEVEEFSNGYIYALGMKRKIFSGNKARNPDGTVNYTKLELI